MNTPDKTNEALEELMKCAELFAQQSMREAGELRPTLLMKGDKGIGLLQPPHFDNEQSKDEFLQIGRVACIAQGAVATVLVTESWMLTPKLGQQLDLTTPPSQSPERQEVVTIMGETRSGHASKILPIQRTDKGQFLGFGEGPELPSQGLTMAGRFSQFLSPQVPDERTREMAQAAMERIAEIQKEKEQKRQRGAGRGLF